MTENNALAIRKESSIIHSYDDAVNAATAMAKSGYFTDARDASQAIVKILAGQEMGFGAFASMSGIFIIQGRPSIGANLMAAAVKGSGRYDYRVKQMTDTVCEIEFFERMNGKLESIGTSKFTIEDAKRAQTKNLEKYPRNMLFARAISNGVRWFCPDAFNGAAVYTPEELGADVDEDGNVVTIEPVKVEVTKPEPVKPTMTANQALADLGFETPKKAEVKAEDGDPYAGVCSEKGEPYSELSIIELSNRFNSLSKAKAKDPAAFTPEQQRKLDAAKHYIDIKRA